jgi:hypothetical protein
LNRDIKLFRLYVAKVPTNDNKYLNQIVEAISKNDRDGYEYLQECPS